jgi:SHS2 domain-containing protein
VGPGFVEIDHSSDIGIEAWGKDLAESLQNATLGLLSLLSWNPVERVVERRIRVSSVSAEDLFVDWLGEVISMVGTHGELYGEVNVERAGEWFAEGVLRGEKIDPERHALRFDVKAATYHRLAVDKRSDGYHARVIFDL